MKFVHTFIIENNTPVGEAIVAGWLKLQRYRTPTDCVALIELFAIQMKHRFSSCFSKVHMNITS